MGNKKHCNSGRSYEGNILYTLKNQSGKTQDQYKKFGGGQLIVNNVPKIQFILFKSGTSQKYIISAEELRNELEEKHK
jgi:hypothetical protein